MGESPWSRSFLWPPPSLGFGVSVLQRYRFDERSQYRSVRHRCHPFSSTHRQIQTSVPRCPALWRTCTHHCIPLSFVASEVGIDVGGGGRCCTWLERRPGTRQDVLTDVLLYLSSHCVRPKLPVLFDRFVRSSFKRR